MVALLCHRCPATLNPISSSMKPVNEKVFAYHIGGWLIMDAMRILNKMTVILAVVIYIYDATIYQLLNVYRNAPKFSDRQVWLSEQTVCTQIRLLLEKQSLGAVWSGSTLFAIPSASFGRISPKKNPCLSKFWIITFIFSGVRIFRNFTVIESRHEKTCLMPYTNNKGADQPAHPRSLISTFIVRCLDSIIPVVFVSFKTQLPVASAAKLAELSLTCTWSQSPEKTGFLMIWLN